VIGTAGTVNTGAIDHLAKLADICAQENLWLHVDGAFGALIALSDTLKPRLAGIERPDSLAFDFHKWLHVPYGAGCVLVRRGDLHRATFAMTPDYLQRNARGLAGGDPWFCDYGPELSRSFRALKVWFTLKEHGVRATGGSDRAQLRAGAIPGRAHPARSAPRAAGSGRAQYRLLPVSRTRPRGRRTRSAECRDRRRPSGVGGCRAVDHHARRSHGDPRLPDQPPHAAERSRHPARRYDCLRRAPLPTIRVRANRAQSPQMMALRSLRPDSIGRSAAHAGGANRTAPDRLGAVVGSRSIPQPG
jgi:Pyridoxal-dependent decarboxylase conserved domain